jgi:YVTN family beta-propeller protein
MTELPSGTITFLFSDIEGSTRLLKQLRERYGEVLTDHQRLLRAAFAEHSGREVDTQGDAFFVAFPTARDAVLAAASGQRALAANAWPDEGQVKVRMGIHTGGAALTAEKYTGLGVHRAARICAAGHGGQVLVSQTTQNLLEDEEEELEGLRLRDLGLQRLKDLDRRIRLYQLEGGGLAADFPPLRTAEAPRTQRRMAILGVAAVSVAAAVLAVLLTRGSGAGVTVAANSVGVIDPRTNKVVDQIPVGREPGAISVGEGAVWVANTAERTISEIDPRTRARAVVGLGKTPTGLAAGLGRVWVAHGLLGAVTHIDPAFPQQSQKTIEHVAGVITGESRAATVAVGGGSVWAAFGDGQVAWIKPSRTPHVAARDFAGTSPSAVVFDAGLVWVANRGDNSVSRFRPTTFGSGQLGLIHVGRGPSALAAGGGSLWIVDAVDGRVTQLDEGTLSTNTIEVGRDPEGIAYGEGSVWVANAKDGTVSRIDPATARVVKTIHVGNSPVSVATGAGLVWFTVRAPA